MQAKNLLYTHIRFWICIMEKLVKIKDYGECVCVYVWESGWGKPEGGNNAIRNTIAFQFIAFSMILIRNATNHSDSRHRWKARHISSCINININGFICALCNFFLCTRLLFFRSMVGISHQHLLFALLVT